MKMTHHIPSDMALPLLMGEWVVFIETIRLRLEQIEQVDPDSVGEGVLADLHGSRDSLVRLSAYIEDGFARTFGGPPTPAT